MYSNYLWATSRSKWVKKPGKKKPSGCIFCKIAKGDRSVPAKVIHKDKEMMVIMNIFPYNVGHLEVIPVRHVVWLDELTEKELESFFRMINKTCILLRKAMNPKALNLGFNIGGSFAGGSILHLHAQIVPRFERDLGFMEVTFDTKVMPESLNQTHKKLLKFAKILRE